MLLTRVLNEVFERITLCYNETAFGWLDFILFLRRTNSPSVDWSTVNLVPS